MVLISDVNISQNISDVILENITNIAGNATNQTIVDDPNKSNGLGTILMILFLFLLFKSKMTGEINKNWEFVDTSKDDCALEKVIGLESVKEEIKYYMDFIKNKEKYLKWNVKLPKGILLAGPPGTGKTLLIKAISKELDIPLLIASGSEFIEKYVGVGASRVRGLFKKAKEKERCIVFIDEIDAVGRQRGFDNNSESSSTVNQLLVEMDGFDDSTDIIVFAATN